MQSIFCMVFNSLLNYLAVKESGSGFRWINLQVKALPLMKVKGILS